MKKNDELVLWVCMRDVGQEPLVANSKRGECAECHHKIWYDPDIPSANAMIKPDTKKVCLECTEQLIEDEDTDVKWHFPHREN